MPMLADIATNLKNLLYPASCPSCGEYLEKEEEAKICPSCYNLIRPNPEPHCEICGHPVEMAGINCPDCKKTRPYYTIARSACVYEGPVKEMIHKFKYGGRRSLAVPLVRLITDFAENNTCLIEGAGLVTSVPLHAGALRRRGFNQSRVLAEAFAGHFSLKSADTLIKTRATARQNELSRQMRLGNLSGIFKCRPEALDSVRGRAILLIDDVMTTGATFNECSRTLLEAGARETRCISVARGL